MFRVLVLLTTALLFTGCAWPRLTATAGPPDSTVYVDGRVAGGQGFAEVRLGYYGHVAVSARANPGRATSPDYLEELQLVPVPPPYSRWLFPFDFFLEAASYAFHDPYHHEVNLELKPRTALVPGIADPDAEAIRTRALEARLAR